MHELKSIAKTQVHRAQFSVYSTEIPYLSIRICVISNAKQRIADTVVAQL